MILSQFFSQARCAHVRTGVIGLSNVPLTFSLLELLFNRFLVSFHALVLFY